MSKSNAAIDPLHLLASSLGINPQSDPEPPQVDVVDAIRSLESLLPTIHDDVPLPRLGAMPTQNAFRLDQLDKALTKNGHSSYVSAWAIWKLVKIACLDVKVVPIPIGLAELPEADQRKIWAVLSKAAKAPNSEPPDSFDWLMPTLVPTARLPEWPNLLGVSTAAPSVPTWPRPTGWDITDGWAALNGKRFPLTGLPAEVLKALINARNHCLTLDTLRDNAWGHNSPTSDSGVYSMVTTLNQILCEELGLSKIPISRKKRLFTLHLPH